MSSMCDFSAVPKINLALYIFYNVKMQQANATLQNRIKHPDGVIMRHRVPTHSRMRSFSKRASRAFKRKQLQKK